MEESNSACPNAFKRDHDQKAPSPKNVPRVKTDHPHEGPVTGLRLGGRGDSYENGFSKVSMLPSVRALKGPMKRSRASYQNMQTPCCQVEGCNLDLRAAKDYHRRHRICESHSKSPKVIVAGLERRFCQQCSRFHDLSEFDDKKRSCRRRLSDHNTRRRRVQPECGQLGSATLSPPLYDQRQEKHSLLNKLPISLSNPTWENANTSTFGQVIFRPSCFTVDDMNKSIFQLHTDLDKSAPIHTSIPRFLDQCCENPQIAPDLLNAHSLLSSSTTWSWSLNETSTMDDGIMLGNYTHPVIRKSNFESQNFQSFSDNIPVEQGAGATMVHSVNNLQGYPHQQEYQLFKAPYDSSGF